MQQMQAIRIRHGFAGPARLPPVRTVSLQILPPLPNVLHPPWTAVLVPPHLIRSQSAALGSGVDLNISTGVGDLFAVLRFSHNLQIRLTSPSRVLSS